MANAWIQALKEYNKNNKEQLSEYYKANKEHISQQKGQKHTCVCGKEYTHNHKSRHEKSMFHKKFVESQKVKY